MPGALLIPAVEVAERLSIPVSTLRHWERSGTAPDGFPAPVRIGRRVMFPRAAIESWVESQIALANNGGKVSARA